MHSPLEQFNVVSWIPWTFGGFNLSLTNSAFFMLLAAGIPILALSLLARRLRTTPGATQAFFEMIYLFVRNLLTETSGEKALPYFTLVFSAFLFVAMGNVLGMLPYAFTFTSHLIVTFALASLILILITGLGFYKHGLSFFRILMPSGVPLWLAPLLIPIEIVSYLARPLSLAVRLFANMMAGHTMLKVFAGFSAMMGAIGILPLMLNVVLIGFECCVALLQAYVFTVLVCLYLRDALELH